MNEQIRIMYKNFGQECWFCGFDNRI